MSIINNLVMEKIGYIQGKEVGTQSDKTKWWIFALGTGIPIISSSLGIVPKFFYPLSAKTREQMYKELFERRSQKANLIENASSEELEEIAKNEF